VARLLIAAGQLDEARERVAIALQLAEETGALFYQAELLRLRAHTTEDTEPEWPTSIGDPNRAPTAGSYLRVTLCDR